MLFNEYGEKDFRLIISTMDGMYPNSPTFTTFAEIEEYIKQNHSGKIDGIYGISQGATVLPSF
ncbi:MAG: hypothetical protein J1F41_10925 [Lachnospiraceae bacterium]|nr:hypothetical protein [Lachnospiraceae bacterium]